jgi:voltage-gated potassium channel
LSTNEIVKPGVIRYACSQFSLFICPFSLSSVRSEQHFWLKISRPILVFVALMALTILGFYFTEGWSFLQGYYAFIRTAFGDWFDGIMPESTAGKLFATFINIVAIVAAGYFFATLSALFVEGELKDILKHKKMDKAIANLKDHFIVCGANNVSRHVIDEFIKTETPFVMIDASGAALEEFCESEHCLIVTGDPTREKVLEEAGISRARGLVAALDNDHDNLFLVLTARGMNPELKIVTRVIEAGAKEKMIKAGANETICPTHIGGLRIASVMVRPDVVTFLDTLLRGTGTTRFEEVVLRGGSKLIGKKFQDAQEAEVTGLSVIAIRKKGASDYLCNPRAEVTMEAGDVLVTLGDLRQKEEFERSYN